MPRLRETLGWVSFVILAAAFGYQSTQFSSQSGGTDFPRCDSDAAKREVIAAIANAPLGKVAGINIIGWDDIRTLKDDYDQRICHAMVSLNTGSKTGASYKFTVHNGEVFVEFEIEDK
ncbi:hypothetical protein JCM15831A_14850 [Asaia astilbis]|uniref:hypothetical protein n=1 Tax=Asaia astilbis TaxID=610244 RepID=UPI0004701B9E|nr:hypothetical protein [Asaia astilbis]